MNSVVKLVCSTYISHSRAFHSFDNVFILIPDLEVETKSIFIFFIFTKISSHNKCYFLLLGVWLLLLQLSTLNMLFKKEKEMKYHRYLFLCSDKFLSTYFYRIKGTFGVFIVSFLRDVTGVTTS